MFSSTINNSATQNAETHEYNTKLGGTVTAILLTTITCCKVMH